MSEPALSPSLDQQVLAGRQVQVSFCVDLGALNIRGASDAFLDAAEHALGVRLPTTPNTWTQSEAGRIGWLGPDEWLLLAPYDRINATQSHLASRLAGMHHAVTDVSDQRAIMGLSGGASQEVLASGCPLDFQSPAFQPGMCAQSHFLRTGVTVWQLDNEPSYLLLVQRSGAEYLWRALADSIPTLT